MNKGLIAGIVVGLVAGTALGYLVLPYFFPSQADTDRDTFYFVQDMDSHGYTVTGSYEAINNMSFLFPTQAGDSVLFTFTCELSFNPSSPDSLVFYADFAYVIDDVQVPFAEEASVQVTTIDAATLTQSVVYRYLRTDLSAGSHNVTMRIKVGGVNLTQASTDTHVLSVQIF